jgi:hypothetical protein
MNLMNPKTKCDKCGDSCEGGSVITRGEGFLNFCRVCSDIVASFPERSQPLAIEMLMKPEDVLSKVDRNIMRARRERAMKANKEKLKN